MLYDYLLVGQGIAGSLLAWQLQQRGQRVLLMDAPTQTSATEVAAGLVNPITGRRLVKTWMIDDLLPVARELYAELSDALGMPLYVERELIRTIHNRGEENDWLARGSDPDYAAFLGTLGDAGPYAAATVSAFSYGRIKQGAQVDIAGLQTVLRKKWIAGGWMREALLDYEQLELTADGVRYEDVVARAVIFCEGWRGMHNPYFAHLPFVPTKGEALTVRIPDTDFSAILKHRVFIAPLGQGSYWVGSTTTHDYTDDQPTPENYAYLNERLGDVLAIAHTVQTHQAAIRPTVKDRRPFIGMHPVHRQLYFFNGLGTKGASLAPYWTRHFVHYLLDGQPLDKRVDIERWKGRLVAP